MHFAKLCQHLLRSKTDPTRTARVPPGRHITQDLNACGCTQRGKQGLDIGLGIKDVNCPRCTMHVFRARATDQKARHLAAHIFRLSTGKNGPGFEERKIGKAARLIA